jgi:hypothetical protein
MPGDLILPGGPSARGPAATIDGGDWIERTSYNAETEQYEPLRIPLRQAYEEAMEEANQLREQQSSEEYKLWRKHSEEQWEKSEDFAQYTVDLFKKTLDNAARTYRLITTMTRVMFGVGIGLFVFAAAYATFADVKSLSVLFAGLGVSTFVAIFVLGPADKAQVALSNLVQTEVCFMAFFEQVRMLSNLAWEGDGTVNIDKAREASSLLYRRAHQAMDLMQNYLERPVNASHG